MNRRAFIKAFGVAIGAAAIPGWIPADDIPLTLRDMFRMFPEPRPDVIWLSRDAYEAYESLLGVCERFTAPETGEFKGCETLKFKGATVAWRR